MVSGTPCSYKPSVSHLLRFFLKLLFLLIEKCWSLTQKSNKPSVITTAPMITWAFEGHSWPQDHLKLKRQVISAIITLYTHPPWPARQQLPVFLSLFMSGLFTVTVSANQSAHKQMVAVWVIGHLTTGDIYHGTLAADGRAAAKVVPATTVHIYHIVEVFTLLFFFLFFLKLSDYLSLCQICFAYLLNYRFTSDITSLR